MIRPSLAVALAFAALTTAACSGGNESNAVFGARVRAYLLEHPEVIQEAAERLRANQDAQADRTARANLPRVRGALERDPRDFVANPNGRVTVTQFYDYRCPHCTNIAPQVVRMIQTYPDVRFVFKEMPIFGDVSDTAAMAAIAVRRANGNSLGFYQALMSARDLTDEQVRRLAAQHGASLELLDNPQFQQQARAQLADARALAGELRIEGTPGFVIGDQVIRGEDLPRITAALQQLRNRRA
jgi:protein-disulfide isomerase